MGATTYPTYGHDNHDAICDQIKMVSVYFSNIAANGSVSQAHDTLYALLELQELMYHNYAVPYALEVTQHRGTLPWSEYSFGSACAYHSACGLSLSASAKGCIYVRNWLAIRISRAVSGTGRTEAFDPSVAISR